MGEEFLATYRLVVVEETFDKLAKPLLECPELCRRHEVAQGDDDAEEVALAHGVLRAAFGDAHLPQQRQVGQGDVGAVREQPFAVGADVAVEDEHFEDLLEFALVNVFELLRHGRTVAREHEREHGGHLAKVTAFTSTHRGTLPWHLR